MLQCEAYFSYIASIYFFSHFSTSTVLSLYVISICPLHFIVLNIHKLQLIFRINYYNLSYDLKDSFGGECVNITLRSNTNNISQHLSHTKRQNESILIPLLFAIALIILKVISTVDFSLWLVHDDLLLVYVYLMITNKLLSGEEKNISNDFSKSLCYRSSMRLEFLFTNSTVI